MLYYTIYLLSLPWCQCYYDNDEQRKPEDWAGEGMLRLPVRVGGMETRYTQAVEYDVEEEVGCTADEQTQAVEGTLWRNMG